jgi:hypothetical protein
MLLVGRCPRVNKSHCRLPDTRRIIRSRREVEEHLHIQQITTCPVSQGLGEVRRDEALTVKIPLGVDGGVALGTPGRSMPRPDPRSVAGDLFAVVRTRRDLRFERMGAVGAHSVETQ